MTSIAHPSLRGHPTRRVASRWSMPGTATGTSWVLAALVMAELLKSNPWSDSVQLAITGVPLFFFAAAIAQYFRLGVANTTDNQYRENNFATTWGTWALIVGELGGIGAIVWGFVQVNLLA